MQEPTKKRRTEGAANIIWHGSRYAVPLKVMEKFKVSDDDGLFTVDEVFGELINETSKPAVLLRGLRNKEGLTQVEFAERIGITQANLSAMENAHRAIGKEMARRIEAEFGMDYRLFL